MTFLSPRLGAFAAFVLAATTLLAGAAAADPSAEAFVTSIYNNYVGKDAKGFPIDSRQARNILTRRLMNLIDADGRDAKRRGEPPALNGDPFVDAQDWQIESFTVQIEPARKDRVRAKVSFKGEPKEPVTLELVKRRSGWRIYDIHSRSGSVRTFLSKR